MSVTLRLTCRQALTPESAASSACSPACTDGNAYSGNLILIFSRVLRICPRWSKKSIPDRALQNLLPKRRERQFDGQVRRAIVLVDHGIHFNDLETQHAAVVGDDLHRQVSLAIGCSSTNRRADAGRVF